MSLLTDLLGTFGTRATGEIAGALGQPEESVARAMPSAVAAVLGAVVSKSGNAGFLEKILGMAPRGEADTSVSGVDSAGRSILSTLFGHSEGQVTEHLASAAEVQPGTMSSLLAIAAPTVVSSLRARAQKDPMNIAGLGSLLQREAPTIQSVLPAGVAHLLAPAEDETALRQMQQSATSGGSRHWVLPAAMMALVPAIWFMIRPATVEPLPPSIGTANRSIPEGSFTARPRRLDLHFKPGSATLLPDAEKQLQQFADSLSSDRDLRVAVKSYTDETGNELGNLRLSRERAEAVKTDLIRMGISVDRLTTSALAGQSREDVSARDREAANRVSLEISDR